MTPPPVSPLPHRSRLAWFAFGAAVFLWLPVEDTSETAPIAFAIVLCGLGAAQLVSGWRFFQHGRFAPTLLAGLLAGLAITPAALMFMAIKTGLHGHSAPDFTTGQMVAVLQRTPVFALGGLLVAAGLALWRNTHPTV